MIPGGWIWNVSGLDAVELLLGDGRVLRVGTDEPEALSRAIAQVAPAAGTAAAQSAAPQAQTPRAMVRRRGRGGRRRGRHRVRHALLPADTPSRGHRHAAAALRPQPLLRGRLPARRDHGRLARDTACPGSSPAQTVSRARDCCAAGSASRAWARGSCSWTWAARPSCVVRLRRGFVILNFSEPEKTRALYDGDRAPATPLTSRLPETVFVD